MLGGLLCQALAGAILAVVAVLDDGRLGISRVTGIGLLLALVSLPRVDAAGQQTPYRCLPSALWIRRLASLVLCFPANLWALSFVYPRLRSSLPASDRWMAAMGAIALEGLAVWWIFAASHYFRLYRHRDVGQPFRDWGLDEDKPR